MPTLSSYLANFRPAKPTFTDENLPDLTGKICLVTGANTGIGKEVARILFAKNATVYLTARSQEKASQAIKDIKASEAGSSGVLKSFELELDDLDAVKTSARKFLDMEDTLHILFNNAGHMSTGQFLKTKQDYEMGLGVNCVGTFLFTQLLTPILAATCRKEPPNTVRVVWLSSFGLELYAVKDVGIDIDNVDYKVMKSAPERYGLSKTGVWALAVEYARRHRAEGIISMPINPGNLTSDLTRDQIMPIKVVGRLVGYPPVMGAYTEVFAALSPEVTLEKSGEWVIPFGRFYPLREDLNKATKLESEGGTGGCSKFWDWCEKQVDGYMST